mmetsp:Transcript_11557/g.16267  ORF Transcript_11557/g.16267 Transcript_11557/m.16267 type:complete len:108 (-) Transcript_11557:106-429(-)
MELNCLALEVRKRLLPLCPEKLWESHPCKCTGPEKVTVVEALKSKDMATGRLLHCEIATMGDRMLPPSTRPMASSSMLTVPSGECFSERLTEKQNCLGWYCSRNNFR